MIQFDIKTVLVGYVLTNAICAAVMVSIWRLHRKRYDGLSLWLVGYILQVTALLFFILGGLTSYRFYTFLGTPSLVVGIFIFFWGLEQFTGKTSRRWPNYLLMAVFLCVHAYFLYVYPSERARNMDMALTVFVICSESAWLLLRRADAEMRRQTRIAGDIFAAYAALSLVNLFMVSTAPGSSASTSTLVEVLVVLMNQMLFITITFSMVLMVNHRLLSDLRKENEARLITDRALVESEERLSLALKGTNTGLWDWYLPTGEAVYDERWASIAGYTLKDLEPLSMDTWTSLCHPDDLVKANSLLNDHFAGKTDLYEFEARMKHKNGGFVWVLNRGKVVERDERGKPTRVTGTHLDITKRKQTEERIKHMATHDALTDLPTLRLADDRVRATLETARDAQKTAAILFVDLDAFKAVNDTYGHTIGDELLKQVAKRILSSVRDTDTVARIGGDEFMVFLAALTSANDAGVVARKIIANNAEPYEFEQFKIEIGLSVGIAIFPDNGDNLVDLLAKADKAMYKVKNSGKNGFVFADQDGAV